MFLLYSFLMGTATVFTNTNTGKINTGKMNNGNDYRYNQTFENDQLYNITKSLKKMELLKILENPDVSIVEKLDNIHYYSFLFDETIKSNMEEGGLYKDWDFEL